MIPTRLKRDLINFTKSSTTSAKPPGVSNIISIASPEIDVN